MGLTRSRCRDRAEVPASGLLLLPRRRRLSASTRCDRVRGRVRSSRPSPKQSKEGNLRDRLRDGLGGEPRPGRRRRASGRRARLERGDPRLDGRVRPEPARRPVVVAKVRVRVGAGPRVQLVPRRARGLDLLERARQRAGVDELRGDGVRGELVAPASRLRCDFLVFGEAPTSTPSPRPA